MRDIAIETCSDDAARAAGFAAVRERVGYPLPDEPVPPGRRRLLALCDDEPVARLSLGLADDLVGAPGTSGLIGHYEALDARAGAALLRRARALLHDDGVARVLGPMNGSTWSRYRLALPEDPAAEEAPAPWFWGEPVNPPEYPDHFRAAGFEIAATYESRIEPLAPSASAGRRAPATDEPTAERSPSADAIAARVAEQGLRERPLRAERFDEELDALYDLSAAAFAGNPYYSPISRERFRGIYAPIRARLDPELVRLVHDGGGRLVAFVFAYPDPLDAANEPAGRRRVVLKTIAVAPDRRRRGLGALLIALVSSLARRRGASAVVHALMHTANASTRISAGHRSTRLLRRYALYRA